VIIETAVRGGVSTVTDLPILLADLTLAQTPREDGTIDNFEVGRIAGKIG
jgi:hypothetical protein